MPRLNRLYNTNCYHSLLRPPTSNQHTGRSGILVVNVYGNIFAATRAKMIAPNAIDE
jgi:hypothetical protein